MKIFSLGFIFFILSSSTGFTEAWTPERLKSIEAMAVGERYPTVDKARTFLIDKKSCQVAIGFSPHNRKSNLVNPNVWCIVEMTYDKGTINEVSGCAFTLFNMKTGKYSIPGWVGSENGKKIVVKNSKCDSSGLTKLLELEVYDSYKPQKVKNYIGGGSMFESGVYPIILFNDHEGISNAVGKGRDKLDALYVEQKIKAGLKKMNNAGGR